MTVHSPPYDMARQVLDLAATLVSDPPARQYVAAGLAAWEPPTEDGSCEEQLTVQVRPYGPTTPGGAATFADPANTAHAYDDAVELAVELVRCVPTAGSAGSRITVPSAADLDVSSQQLCADGWALYTGICQARRAGTLLGSCELLQVGRVEPFTPSGGLGGLRLILRAYIG